MNAIQNLAKTAFWTYRKYILPATTLVIPGALEAINLVSKVYQNPSILKQKFDEFKNKVNKSFSHDSLETEKKYYKRLNRKLLKIVSGVLLGACSTTFLYCKLTPSIATPIALVSLAGIGFSFSLLSKIPSKKAIIHKLNDGFYQRLDESDVSYQKRKISTIKTIIKTCSIGISILMGIGFGGYIASLLSKVENVWRAYDVLPKQTNAVVSLEYSILGLAHAFLALHNHFKDKKAQVVIHSLAAIAAILFPLGYLIVAKEGESIRIHHSFLGLFFQLFEWKALQFFGMVITFDSSLYFISPERGYELKGEFHSYDFQNSVVDNIGFVINSLSYLCLAESAIKRLFHIHSEKRENNNEIEMDEISEDDMPIRRQIEDLV